MSSRTGSRRSRPASSSADESSPAWLVPAPGGAIVRVHARPGASRSGIAGVHGQALKVHVRARPIEGAANRELEATLALALAVRPATVSVVAGGHGREKRVRVEGL